MLLKRRNAGSVSADEVRAIAERIMREQSLSSEVRLDVPLDEEGLGLDSMARLDLFAAIEKECAVSIPEKYWGGRKVKDLNDLMRIAVARR